MSRTILNRNLLIAAVVLLALSAFSYHNSIQRAERFERGQKFLPNLNPDDIAQVVIKKGETETRLKRSADGERFLIPSENGYRAQNSAVNRFIKDVLSLSLEKEVGSGESLEKELELVAGPDHAESIEVVFTNSSDKEMVRFVSGKAFDGGSGNYVLRADDPERTIYLTDKRVYLSTDGSDFLDKEIINIERDKIDAILGADYRIDRGPSAEEPANPADEASEGEPEGEEGGEVEKPEPPRGELALAGLPDGKKESSKVAQLKGLLSSLRFDQHHLADAPEVADLVFTDRVDMELENGSIYVVEVASKGETNYLRIQGFHTAAEQGGVSIARDATDEEVKQTSDVLEAIDNLQTFNAFHGSWIYEVSDIVADKVRLKASDLMEDA